MHAAEPGEGLRTVQRVMTGPFTGLALVEPGDTVEAVFDRHGEASVAFDA